MAAFDVLLMWAGAFALFKVVDKLFLKYARAHAEKKEAARHG